MATTLEEINAIAGATWLTEHSVRASLNNIPLLYLMYQEGCFKETDFSSGIKVPAIFARKQVKATDGSGTDMTVHNDQANFAPTVAWKTLSVKVIITKDILDLSKSTAEVVSGVLGQLTASQSAILNSFDGMAWGDGTGDNGRAIDGFGLAISKTPAAGTYAGIDPSVVPQWRNASYNALDANSGLPNAGQPITKDNILSVISYVRNKQTLNGKTVSHIFVGDYYYNMIDQAMIQNQRIIANGEVGKLGFNTLMYGNTMIVNCGGLKRDSDLGAYAGIGEKEMYFVTLDDVFCAYNNPFKYSNDAKALGIETKDINAIVYPEMHDGKIIHKAENNLDYYVMLVFKGNMLLGDRKRHAVVYEEAVTPPSDS